MKEEQLQRAAAAYLAKRRRIQKDIQFAHIPNEIRRSGAAARWEIARKKQEGMTPGAPDFVVWLKNGPVVSIELKVGSRAHTDNQRHFMRTLDLLHHPYELVRAKEPGEAAQAVKEIVERYMP